MKTKKFINFIMLHWRAFLSRSFVALGGIWTAVQLYVALAAPDISSNSLGLVLLFSVIAFSFLIGAYLVWESIRGVVFKLRGIETTLRISFGNVFDGDADLVVPANTYFDHLLHNGTQASPVSLRSVHGQLIENMTPDSFRSKVDSALSVSDVVVIDNSREIEPRKVYGLGTVAALEHEQRHYYLVAVTNTDNNDNYKAKSSLPEIFSALTFAWRHISTVVDNRNIRMPFIGNGFGNVCVDPEHLLDILIASIVEYSLRERRITSEIEIVLPLELRGRIRCYNVKAEWS